MEQYKINRVYHHFIEKSKEHLDDEWWKEQAEKYLTDIGATEVITVLYSYNHSLTGEKMHFVREDSVFKSLLTGEYESMSKHKEITDGELQEKLQFKI